jgi:hypothetical protein
MSAIIGMFRGPLKRTEPFTDCSRHPGIQMRGFGGFVIANGMRGLCFV